MNSERGLMEISLNALLGAAKDHTIMHLNANVRADMHLPRALVLLNTLLYPGSFITPKEKKI